MKKLIIVALSAVLAVMAIEPAHAEDQRVLAVIDSAIDSSKVPSVIYEACFTISTAMGCSNGQTLKDSNGTYSFSEGKGSASSPVWPSTQIGNLGKIYHGYNVVQAAVKSNPNMKIVFVRMAGVAKTNGMQAADPEDSKSVIRAIKWISDNAEKYSIDAVSISQSWITPKALSLCSEQTLLSSVSSLSSKNIPVFAATGNDGSPDKVGFPSCSSGVIGVGSANLKLNVVDKATNKGSGLRVVAPNSISIVRYNGTTIDFTATSAATPQAAAVYVGSYKTIELFINGFSKVLNKYPYISN